MTAEQMWAEFASGRGLDDTPYEAWAYGGDADALARLTLAGKKTATSSALPLYGLEGAPLPEAGEYSVILDSRKQAVCVIRTERVAVVPYRDVTADHARREGGGRLLPGLLAAGPRGFFHRGAGPGGNGVPPGPAGGLRGVRESIPGVNGGENHA